MTPATRLNLFRWPSQTTLLFVVIAGIMAGAFLSAAFPLSPASVGGVFLTSLWLALTIRSFLCSPEQEVFLRTRQELDPAKYTALYAEINQLAVEADLRCPKLWLALDPGTLHAFGTFTRHGIAIGQTQADWLERALQSPNGARRAPTADREPARAALLHELQHIKLGDVVLVGLARSLLQSAALVMGWATLFLIGWAALFAYPLAEIASPEFVEQLSQFYPVLGDFVRGMIAPEMQAQIAQPLPWLNVASYFMTAHLPVLVGAGLLYLTVWRRLLQVREFYADAGVARALGNGKPMRRALWLCGTVASLHEVKSIAGNRRLALFLFGLARATFFRRGSMLDHLRRAFDFHPPLEARLKVLENPEESFGSPTQIGLTAALLVTFVDLALTGSYKTKEMKP